MFDIEVPYYVKNNKKSISQAFDDTDINLVKSLLAYKNHMIKFAPDGKTHTRIQLSKGAGTILVSDDYKTIYQQMTGKVFIG